MTTLKMAARGPLASERRLSCCLTSAATRTPAPRPQRRLAAPPPAAGTGRGARRRRARAAGSWAAAGTGAGSPRLRTPRAHAAPRRAAPPARPAPLRSAPLPLPLPLPPPPPPPLPLPPFPGDAIGAAPPPSPPRKRPTPADPTEIGPGVTKLMEKKTKGLEAPSFPSVTVGVPDASGRTNPVAFMSNVLCCVCLQGKTFWLPLSLRSPWVCRTPLAGLTLWLLCPTCCAVCACRGRLSAPLGEPQCLAGAERASREVFTCSASGTILPEASAPSFPSVAVGVPDASGRTNPVAFMSNVLWCVPADKATFPRGNGLAGLWQSGPSKD
ncbi:histone-lysine N-methyltransferase SETD1B-like [Manacus candei]|uniref:histone-lysine N-methyltransferase SETD1B-like n=1 Tax=Manacus candei TaxID=415023 RepID=UPI002226F50A|nr:histone-lysine N-methyltransferase SETD1B-like [Manacus candei]